MLFRSERKRRGRKPKAQTVTTGSNARGEQHGSDVSTPSRAPPKRASYATPTGPGYQARVSAMDVEQRLEEDDLAERVRQERALAQQHVVKLQWWKEVNHTIPTIR